jgi:hypothetical protein
MELTFSQERVGSNWTLDAKAGGVPEHTLWWNNGPRLGCTFRDSVVEVGELYVTGDEVTLYQLP